MISSFISKESTYSGAQEFLVDKKPPGDPAISHASLNSNYHGLAGNVKDAISPDANHGHGKADTRQSSLYQLVLYVELNIAANLLTIDFFLSVFATEALVAVGVTQQLVALLHALSSQLFLPSLGQRSPLLREVTGSAEESRSNEACETSAKCEKRCVEKVRVSETARGEGEGEQECGTGGTSERIEVGCGSGAYRAERLRGARGRGEIEELGDREGGEGIGCALLHSQYVCLRITQ